MHHDPGIVQGDQALGLVAVGQEGAGHGLANQQTDHRVPGQPRLGVGLHGTGQCLVNAQRFLAAAIGLAGHIDYRDNGTLLAVTVSRHRLAHRLGQAPAFKQADFTRAGTGEWIAGIRHHGDEARQAVVQLAVDHPQRCGVTWQGLSAGQARQPVQGTVHWASPW
ncbi:hypothetical protein D3C80_1395300 [compost metagenome]